jgi:peptidoglycan/xylan/chitin deacetylase (PgdA/CDA1 family)
MNHAVESVIDVLSWSRALDGWQALTGKTCTVLVYHSVASGEANPFMAPAAFASQMDMIASEFRVLSADEYLWHLDRGLRPPRRSVLITFDDGLENNYSVVQPIMRARGLPWVLFTTTIALERPDAALWFTMLRALCVFARASHLHFLGRSWSLGDRTRRLRCYAEMNAWARHYPAAQSRDETDTLLQRHRPEIPPEYISSFVALAPAEKLLELSRSGLVEIGCHTRTHPFLPCTTDDELAIEIDGARQKLQDAVQKEVRMFAYPSGAFGRRELRRVGAAGFRCAFSVDKVLSIQPELEITRTGVYSSALSVARAKALGLSALLRGAGLRSG